MKIETRVTGLPEALAEIREVPKRLLDRFQQLAEEAAEMAASDIEEAVSGGAVGPGKGILARAVDYGVRRKQDTVVAWAGSKPRARFLFRYHDQGFHGPVRVQAHVRQGWQAFGRSYFPRRHVVPAHVRTVDYSGHHFMAPAAERAGNWLAEQWSEEAS